jgi:hypothetical protein
MVGLFPAHFINKRRNKGNYDNSLLVFPSSLAEPNIKFYKAVILDSSIRNAPPYREVMGLSPAPVTLHSPLASNLGVFLNPTTSNVSTT